MQKGREIQEGTYVYLKHYKTLETTVKTESNGLPEKLTFLTHSVLPYLSVLRGFHIKFNIYAYNVEKLSQTFF